MRRPLVMLLDLGGGLALAAVAILGGNALTQGPTLVFLLLPLVCLLGFALGAWRAHASLKSLGLVPILLNLPLALLLWGSPRATFALPVLGAASSALGVLAASSWQSRRKQVLLLLGLAIGVLVAVTPRFADSLVVRREVNEPAVPFQLSLMGGGVVAAEQLRGQVVVVAFWATWCVPCQHELPELQRLYERFEKDPRVAFFAVDFGPGDRPDDKGDTPERAEGFFRRFGYRLPLAYDADGSLARTLSAHGLPYLLVLDREGRIRLRHAGFVGSEGLLEKLTATIRGLLPEARASALGTVIGSGTLGGRCKEYAPASARLRRTPGPGTG
jgi:thiol-disulfide isomerase/thioredoxin